MKLLQLAKLARGVTTKDQALELLESMGIKADAQPINEALTELELKAVCDLARSNGAKFYLVNADMKGGGKVVAFVMLKGGGADELQNRGHGDGSGALLGSGG